MKPAGILFVFLFSALAATAQQPADSPALSYDSVMAKISERQVSYSTFSARAKLSWNDGETPQEFTGSIRLKKDSTLWLSLGVIGIEGIRTLVTPDTFRLMNKLTGEYAVHGINYIQSWLLFPVSFNMLQQLITGEKISIGEKASAVTSEDSSVVLYSESDQLYEKIWVDTSNYTIQKILLKDKLLKQDMLITFTAYNYSEAKPFSYKRSVVITRNTDTVKLNMDFVRINFNEELSFPFDKK